MPKTAANAELQLEFGATPQGTNQLTDSGDRKKFTSGVAPWSRLSAYEPVIKPNGLRTGGKVTPAISGTNDLVDVAALTCWLAGVDTSVSAATDQTVLRGSGTASNDYRINSITVNSAGAIAVVNGTEGTAFSETRAAAGGPPLIPVDSIEIAQVRLSSPTAAAVTASEVYDTVDLHKELASQPVWQTDFANGEISFISALPAIHTGSVGKQVFAIYAQPNFAEVADATDYVAPEESYTVNSVQVYKRTIGSSSKSLNQGSFTAFLENGVRDPIMTMVGEKVWTKFYPDPVASTDHILANGILGTTRAFPPGDNISGAFTLSADAAGKNVAA